MQAVQKSVNQKELSAADLDVELMGFITDYLATVEHPCSFFVHARELLTKEDVSPDDYCVLVALHNKTASEFPATAAKYEAKVITTREDEHFAALFLRDETVVLPDHALKSYWNAPFPRRLLIVYQFADAAILENVPMTESLIHDLCICGVTAQSGNRPTYAELGGDAVDTTWDRQIYVLDNRHIQRKDMEQDKSLPT